ncbi:F-box and WD repeat domain containing protein 10B [Antennarius striatus]|uniref:F-box and WD repeat domain containing protein 10B n=1 Tax=Antennarius striatus TaxID=241820 RepID=UPI0035AFBD76
MIGSVSAREMNSCVNACGICQVCVFSRKSPGSTHRVWKVSDGFKRRFLLGLILRCRDIGVLQSVQTTLRLTSWSLFAYARSKRPIRPQDYPTRNSEPNGNPPSVDTNEMWDWFDSSPNWIKTHYICNLLSRCDLELLCMVANLTNVLLVSQKQALLQSKVTSAIEQEHDSDEDSEDPALMVVPGSSKSVSGVSRYRDFISCLPVSLSKTIIGLLNEPALKSCLKVCQYWQRLTQETMEETKFRKTVQQQMKSMVTRSRRVKIVHPTQARIVEVPVPVEDDEEEDIQSGVQKDTQLEDGHAEAKTKMVQMEERNVYCGAYFTRVLLNNTDPHRELDYRGGSLMAVGSKDCKVQLFYVGSHTKMFAVMKGHTGSIRAVLLCQDRGLVITASCDTSLRCWDLKTDECLMAFYGHNATVSCLDIHADRLVSGGKDCLVKVWCLKTGKNFDEYQFKHPNPIQCVKISEMMVYSSCSKGSVKIWDMESSSLIRVIDAHKSSVKCLFVDQWHLLSGDCSGQVMAWSSTCDSKQCLMTFSHPKEVKYLTLIYLRLITGCADGKIRIFNFISGGLLREITAEVETGQIRSVHVHEDCILVNSKSSVKHYQFAKVFWDYADSTKGGHAAVSDKSDASLRQLHLASVGAGTEAQVDSPCQKIHDSSFKKPEITELLPRSHFQAEARDVCAKQSVIQSEKATNKLMKSRGLPRPFRQDAVFLKLNAVQREQRTDEASVNTESNSRPRVSWGPPGTQSSLLPDPQDPKQNQNQTQSHIHEGGSRESKTCVSALGRTVSQNMTISGSHSADPHGAISQAPDSRLATTPEYSLRSSLGPPRTRPVDPFKEQAGLRLLTATQAEDRETREKKLFKCQEKRAKKTKHLHK